MKFLSDLICMKMSSIEISKIQLDIILGSILGDGNLEKSPTTTNYGLSIKHGLKQEAYCLYKAFLLSDLVTKVDYPKERIRLRTKKHKLITDLAQKFIINGRKSINYELINQIGPLGFAIWYLDDGNLLPNRMGNGKYQRKAEIRFATACFTEEENLILRKILEEKIGIETTKCCWKSKRNFKGELLNVPKTFYGIRLYGENAERFIDFIKPSIDWEKSGMAYKIDTTLRGPLDNKHTRKRSEI